MGYAHDSMGIGGMVDEVGLGSRCVDQRANEEEYNRACWLLNTHTYTLFHCTCDCDRSECCYFPSLRSSSMQPYRIR
jgi:hypothetical protein